MLNTILKLFVFVIFSHTLVQAEIAHTLSKETCYKAEINPTTKTTFKNKSIYDEINTLWDKKMPTVADPFDLLKAYQVYKNERINLSKISSDKVKHCYTGCKIRHGVNFKTAQYTGWHKEKEDLTDCKMSSHFEPIDYEATVDGAKSANGTTSGCLTYCKSRWKK